MSQSFNKNVKSYSGNDLFLDALKRLQTLLIPGSNQCIDTEAEVKFLLNHLNDPIDTPMEINELIDNLIDKIKNNTLEVGNNLELKTAIDNLIDKLEAAGHLNRPGLG
ncbi:MAG: hypothetical protein EBY16_06265 [Gammaproteobacteria bacterium]|nr:hypothetical protein [Gammaproteobacteria bacterium]